MEQETVARPAWLPVAAIVLTLGLALAFLLGGQRGAPELPARLSVGSLGYVLEQAERGPVVLAEYPEVAVVSVRTGGDLVTTPRWGLEDGTALVTLDRMLVALDLRDPAGGLARWCLSSQRFENTGTSGAYSLGGGWRAGPSPRGLDRFGLDVRGNEVVVDTTVWVPGLDRDTAHGAERAAGPACEGTDGSGR